MTHDLTKLKPEYQELYKQVTSSPYGAEEVLNSSYEHWLKLSEEE